ncbi:MAG: hypothetical protein QOK15_344 [Nocardioidaceae bacterium]|jgi:uncharacterized protein (TIGR02611 family)|nr:hypothetical protein [Nocardioidaceae bacterium]
MPRVPGHAAVKRIVLELVGWLLVAGGIAALILPGPGLLMLFGGLAILSRQYAWAERRMRPVEVRAKKAAAESVQTWPRVTGSTCGALMLVGLGVLWVVRPAVPDWWPAHDGWWLVGGWPTGVTLIGSGLVALALIVHSFRTYRGAGAGQV